MRNVVRLAWAVMMVLVLASTSSCREESDEKVNPNEQSYGTFLRQFDVIYNGILYSYPHWDVDTANVIGRHDYWRAKAAELDTRDQVEYETLKNIYENMYGTMLDHHMSIMVRNLKPCPGESDRIYVSPGDNEVSRRIDAEPSYIDYNHVQEMIAKMYSEGRVTEWCSYYVEDSRFGITSCLFDGDILYLYFSGFALREYRDNDTEDAVRVNEVIDNYLNIISTKQDLKGVIIDVRGNGGGYVADLITVLGSLTDSPQLMFSSRKKNGTGMYDYAPFVETYMRPYERHLLNKDAKIVGLCDLYTVSCAEVTSSFIKELPNGHLIGKNTFGGTCILGGIYEDDYAGTFGSQDDGHWVYMPNYQTRYGKDRKLYEGVGVPPDEIVSYDKDLFDNQTEDTQLNAAINHIRRIE